MKKKLSLIQRLTDEFFRLRPKVRRDPLTKEHLLVRNRYHRVENILRKRLVDAYTKVSKHAKRDSRNMKEVATRMRWERLRKILWGRYGYMP